MKQQSDIIASIKEKVKSDFNTKEFQLRKSTWKFEGIQKKYKCVECRKSRKKVSCFYTF